MLNFSDESLNGGRRRDGMEALWVCAQDSPAAGAELRINTLVNNVI